MAPYLARYWWASRRGAYLAMVHTYAGLIAHSVSEHAVLVEAAGAHDLVARTVGSRPTGHRALAMAVAEARWLAESFGIAHVALDGAGLRRVRPSLRADVAGAIHWQDPWTVRSPLGLTQAYERYFRSLGGQFVVGDAMTLATGGVEGWSVRSTEGMLSARHAVVALGPWSTDLTRQLGYAIPMGLQRGYSMHYRLDGNEPMRNWVADRDMGYLVAPMLEGIRITTGAEFAHRDAPPRPVQLDQAEQTARALFPLGQRIDPKPWLGARPCMPDMIPIIGPAPRHAGLWFAFGHAHHGLTLGPVTGRLIAELITGQPPLVDVTPFSAARF